MGKSRYIQDFQNKQVLIMGLGVHGRGEGIVRFFAKCGAKIMITDLKKEGELNETLEKIKHIPYEGIFGRHRFKDFGHADLIIKNPGVPRNSPYLQYAKNHGTPVDTDVGIFFKYTPATVIGVTGTKGKSTTTSLIFDIVKRAYPNTRPAGIRGTSILNSISHNGFVVAELSSWDLEGLSTHKKSPHLALVTNLYPDHLNTYSSFSKYVAAKKLIFRFQKKKNGDVLFLNYDNLITRKFAKESPADIIFFSKNAAFLRKVSSAACGAWIQKDKVLYGKKGIPVFSLSRYKAPGMHNIENLLGAISVAMTLKIPHSKIQRALATFKNLEGRLEQIRTFRGITYVNDTCATIPNATEQALDTFQNTPLVLILGGVNKNITYGKLARKIAACNVKSVVLLPGSASDLIKEALAKQRLAGKIKEVRNMKGAVFEAGRSATSGNVVLLSPGAASFNLFKNEFDRGNAFVRFVKELS